MTTKTTDVPTIPVIPSINLQLVPKSSFEVAEAERKVCGDDETTRIVRLGDTSLCYYHYDVAFPPRPVFVLCARLSPVITGAGTLRSDDYLLEIDSYVKGTGQWQQMAQVAQKSFGHQPAKVPTKIGSTKDRACFPLDLEFLKNLRKTDPSCAIICSYPVMFFRYIPQESFSLDKPEALYLLSNDWAKIQPQCVQCEALSHKEKENPEECPYVSKQMSQLLLRLQSVPAVQLLGKTYVEKRVEIRPEKEEVEVSVRIEGQEPISLGKFSKSLLFFDDSV